MDTRSVWFAAVMLAAGPVHAEQQSAAQTANQFNFILEFATKSAFGQEGDVVSGYYLLCSRGACSLTLTATSANACTGATPQVPAFVRSFEYDSKDGSLDISRLGADSVQIKFAWTWGLTEMTSVLEVKYKPDTTPESGLAQKPVTKVSGNAYPATGRGAYDYKFMPGPVSCTIEFSGN
jgi:hypothetical protein